MRVSPANYSIPSRQRTGAPLQALTPGPLSSDSFRSAKNSVDFTHCPPVAQDLRFGAKRHWQSVAHSLLLALSLASPLLQPKPPQSPFHSQVSLPTDVEGAEPLEFHYSPPQDVRVVSRQGETVYIDRITELQIGTPDYDIERLRLAEQDLGKAISAVREYYGTDDVKFGKAFAQYKEIRQFIYDEYVRLLEIHGDDLDFKTKLLFPADNADQGTIGDCFLVASMIATLSTDELKGLSGNELMAGMFSVNENHELVVTFRDDPRKRYVVHAGDFNILGIQNNWPAIMLERAFGKRFLEEGRFVKVHDIAPGNPKGPGKAVIPREGKQTIYLYASDYPYDLNTLPNGDLLRLAIRKQEQFTERNPLITEDDLVYKSILTFNSTNEVLPLILGRDYGRRFIGSLFFQMIKGEKVYDNLSTVPVLPDLVLEELRKNPSGTVAVADSTKDPVLIAEGKDFPLRLIDAHSYIIQYNPETEKYVVSNPWNFDEFKMEMTADQVKRYFVAINAYRPKTWLDPTLAAILSTLEVLGDAPTNPDLLTTFIFFYVFRRRQEMFAKLPDVSRPIAHVTAPP